MSNLNAAAGGLQYRGTRAQSPPNLWTFTQLPTTYDTQGFQLGDFWLYVNTKAIKSNQLFCLVNLYGDMAAKRTLATWSLISSGSTGDLLSLTDQIGTVVTASATGTINLIGFGPVTTAGTPSTNTFTISVAVATTSTQGTVQLSTNADTIAGVDTGTAVTPASLAAKLGTQTLDGVAYGGATNMAVNWTALGANNTVLTGTGGAPAFASSFTVGNIILNAFPGVPTSENVATVGYVNDIASGFTFIAPVRVATIADLGAVLYNNGTAGVGATLTNNGVQAALNIDGVALNMSDRVLVKNESTPTYNGVYSVTTVGSGATNWVLTRTTDYDMAPGQIKPGNLVPVTAGTVNVDSIWLQTDTVATIGTDPIDFVPFGVQPEVPLPIAGGGTNATSFSPTDGVIYFDGTKLNITAAGTNGQVLTSQGGSGSPPIFQTISSGGGSTTTVYNTPGTYTWTANASTEVVEIFGWGSGGGGSGGSNPGSVAGGGGGGAFYYKIPITLLPGSPASVEVIVPTGGAGGSGSVSPGIGSPGGIASFGNFVSGSQPAGGGGGNNGMAGNGGFVFTSYVNTFVSYTVTNQNLLPANRGRAPASGIIPDLNFGSMLPGGGGCDGGLPSGPLGQSIINPATGAVIVAGGTQTALNGTNGADGYSAGIDYLSGGAGGGAGHFGGNGGNGGFPGGGGGSAGTLLGGTGGAGGNGLVIVIEYT